MGNEEGFEEWDAEFLDQLIQVEELALSSSSTAIPNPSTASSTRSISPPVPPQRQEPPTVVAGSHCELFSYSPPRELSQRTTDFDPLPRSSNGIAKCPSSLASVPAIGRSEIDKEVEIERLKRELGRVSKQLSHLEHECSKLRKERDKKEEDLNNVHPIKGKSDAVVCLLKSSNLHCGAPTLDSVGNSRRYPDVVSLSNQDGSQNNLAVSTYKGTGVQTDDPGVCAQVILNNDPPSSQDLSKKLLAIWDSPNVQTSGRNLISNLLVSCEPDFRDLFGHIGTEFPLKLRKRDSQADETSEKVCALYSMLMKVNNGMVQLEALIEPLLDLCCHCLSMSSYTACVFEVSAKFQKEIGRKCNLLRDNIMVEGLCSGDKALNPHKSESAEKGDLSFMGRDRTSCAAVGTASPLIKFLDAETLCKKGQWNPSISISVYRVDWVCLFKKMLHITMKSSEESVRLEAVSTMNVILMASNACTEREKFGNDLVFECVSKLLRKEAGLRVQKHTMQLLYLLLHCPKLLVTFCSGCTEQEDTASVEDNKEDTSAFKKFTVILQGLADCVTCDGNDLERLKLRRNAVVLLAFLASSGTSGFEILAHHNLSNGANFLMLILQVLVSEMDMEAAAALPKSPRVSLSDTNKEEAKEVAESPEVFKERTLLIREALILLNRLVSSPAYSATALQLLTKRREMAFLTIDIANRLSRQDQSCGQFDGMARLIRESEVVDLARVFKKRVFTYLGDPIS
ncbi:hypothetical protein FNV43_RR10369 [Rhamnella rubrinervis]|uniref:Protein SENSITIVE TO UV 2 n=1 Tax=Rhamnella rubrinervis TaxID=2594499 RepID=A0A8K0HD44_9ROSA|nr:hypothetical protein FNV43_RR10369 [Rhamnella rubrinervis]